MNTLYGIKNCDTIKKARKWLDKNKIDYHYHDYRTDGLDEDLLKCWCKELGHDNLLNRRGTTWRKLPEKTRESIDVNTAIKIMLENPSVIKRPLLDTGERRLLGFSESDYQSLLK